MSEDGKVWTFTLRKNVTFHDGTPFNADAVVANIQRHIDPKGSLAASSRMRNVIASVKKIDDGSVEITLKKSILVPKFTHRRRGENGQPGGGQSRHHWPQADGTGPYMLQEYKTGEYVLEKKNPHYWEKAAARSKSNGPGARSLR